MKLKINSALVCLLFLSCTPGEETARPAPPSGNPVVDPSPRPGSEERPRRQDPRPGEVVFYRLHPDERKVDRYCGAHDRSYVVETVNVGRDQAVLTQALRALFHRYWKVPGAVVESVSLSEGQATVGIRFHRLLGWASTSCGSVSFLGSILRTSFQFPSVESVRLELDGSCRNFGKWMQSGRCTIFTRAHS